MPDIAVVLITLNEAENLAGALENLRDFASEVWVLDSYSTDETVSIAIARGASVAQRTFRGFGDQWNFALQHLPVRATWTMKMDPDERLSDELKSSITKAIESGEYDGLRVMVGLRFLGRRLGVRLDLVRIWRTGTCRFTNVLTNEHPLVGGTVGRVKGEINHLDSTNLHRWYEKQNRYTTDEAFSAVAGTQLGVPPSLFGSRLARRMWLKQHFARAPFRYVLIRWHYFIVQGAWRSGRTGWVWSRLRADVHRMIGLKAAEMRSSDEPYRVPPPVPGARDARAIQYD